jgi:hypothetical protein
MIQAYGRQIVAVIRGADGQPVTKSPDTTFATEAVPASVLTPYRDTIMKLIEAGFMPCTGQITLPTHVHYTAPFELRPLMSYTFDIELTGGPAPTGTVQKPFYRRTFTTSRYADLADFAGDLRKSPVRHRALGSLPVGLPTTGAGFAVMLTDREFETILTTAGVAGDEAPEQVGFTVLWSNQAGDYVPYAILIRASEPIWRVRTESQKTVVKDARNLVIDPAFAIYENKPVMAMRLERKASEGVVRHFIHNTTGTLTLALLQSSAFTNAVKPVSIDIVQAASSFYGLTEKRELLISLSLSGRAPWED